LIAQGASFTAAGRVVATLSAGPTATLQVNGFGFAAGVVVLDSNAIAGSIVMDGIARSAAGAMYGTTSTAGTDVFLGGMRLSATGQLVVAQADPARIVNGNPVDANGAWCIQ
jgi:hypothetical protein